MLVADIVKTLNQKEYIGGLNLHGVVRGIINTPQEYEGVVLSSGEFAVLDLYALSCKQENHFDQSKTTLLSPKGSLIFILEDKSLIGKLVTIKGTGYKGYVKLRKQKSETKTVGFNCLEFRKSTGPNWVVIPNKVEEFSRTDDKEITNYLLESKNFGFHYLELTKKYLSFSGASSYQLKSSVDIGQTNHSSFTTSFSPTWKTDLNDIKGKVCSAEDNSFTLDVSTCLLSNYTQTLMRKVTDYNEDSELEFRLIPNTNSRFAQVVPRGSVRDYLSLIKILFKTNLSKLGGNTGLSYRQLQEVIGSYPHYLYLKGELSFELAEKIFYINGLVEEGSSSVYYRNLALLVEGAKNTYKSSGTTYLLSSLANKLTCKVPEELRENIKVTGTPLSKEECGFVKYFLEGLPKYNVDAEFMYYPIEMSEYYLKEASNKGLIIEFNRNYMLTEYAKMELSVLERFSKLQESSIDYTDYTLDEVLSFMEEENDIVFSSQERLAFLTLNSNIGLIIANGVSNKENLEEAFHLMYNTETPISSNTVVLVKDSDMPSWVNGSESRIKFLKLSDLTTESLNSNSLVLVHDANTWSLEDYYKLVQHNFKALYLFGNPYTSTNYFKTLALALPRAYTFAQTNEEVPLSIVNNGYLINIKGGKKVTFKDSTKLYTVDVLVRMLKTAFESGYSFENMYVISDLEKHLSAYKVSKKLVELLGYSEELQKGSPVYLENEKLAWVNEVGKTGENLNLILDESKLPITLPVSSVIPALCLKSDVAARKPKDISYALAQRGYGDYYKEGVYNSLDSATKGIAFIGDEEYVLSTHFKLNEPKSTLLKKRLLK